MELRVCPDVESKRQNHIQKVVSNLQVAATIEPSPLMVADERLSVP
jgi:hypothetical protein